MSFPVASCTLPSRPVHGPIIFPCHRAMVHVQSPEPNITRYGLFSRWHRRASSSAAGSLRRSRRHLFSSSQRNGDRRIPVVERPREVLKKQQRVAGRAAETAMSIRFVLRCQELRRRRDVAGGSHRQEIAELASRGPAGCANGDLKAARLVNPDSPSTRPQ